MRYLLYILVFCSAVLKAQDKLFFNNGTTQTGIIVSMGKDMVYFKLSDTSATQRIKKSDLIMAENYKGTRYVFGTESSASSGSAKPGVKTVRYRNSIGVLPFGLFMGRATLAYERLSDDGKVGIVFPLSLTFNPYNSAAFDTISVIRKRGVNFLGGVDLNFYFGEKPFSKFFIGPRIRYGTDVLLFDTQLYSIQTQIGWKFEDPEKRFVQHVSFGFGVLKPLTSAGIIVNGRTLGCFSFNYRQSIKW